MLIEFSVENFLSFNERQTFSMLAAPELDAREGLIENTFEGPGGIRLLRSALVYGANASGKSNLIKALHFARLFVLNSAKETQAGEEIDVVPFRLDRSATARPSRFEFIWLDGSVRFRYLFAVDAVRVVEEALFRAPASEDLETELFHRDVTGIFPTDAFAEGKDRIGSTRDNALFLSVAAQLNGLESQAILKWFRDRVSVVSEPPSDAMLSFTWQKIREGSWKEEILRLAREADLGITSIATRESLKLGHRRLDPASGAEDEVEFRYEDESDGTQKFIAMTGPLLDVLHRSVAFVIDELDARLHPRLTRAIAKLFSGGAGAGTAQLIAATHDTNLLDRRLFRRDQIWFTEKDPRGATKLYSLAEFEVPEEAVYERDYLLGKFGGVPVIGELVIPEPAR